MTMDTLKQLCITLTLITATGYVCASEADDPNLLFSNPVVQQLIARLNDLEEQGKIQQRRIAELESHHLVHQKQDKIQQHRIAELESHHRAHQKQDKIQQHRITELESRDRVQHNIISDLEAAVRNQQEQMEELKRSLTETNLACDHLQEALTAKHEDIKDYETDEHNEDSSTDNHRILARRQQPEVNTVAFTVVLIHARNDLGLNQNVVFDHVETNIGNAYNPHHGVFTAPVAGTYVFHMTIFAVYNAEAWCIIVVNGVNKVDVYARGGTDHHDQGSQTLIVRLNQGDDVAIQNGHAHDNVFGNSDTWTTFSGFLLRSDAEVNNILG